MKSSVSTTPRTNRPALGYLRSVAWDGVRPFPYRAWGGPLLGYRNQDTAVWSAAGTPPVGFRYLDPDFGFWRSAAPGLPGAPVAHAVARSAPMQTRPSFEPTALPIKRVDDAPKGAPAEDKKSSGAVEAAKTQERQESVDAGPQTSALRSRGVTPAESAEEPVAPDAALPPVEPIALDIPAGLQAPNTKPLPSSPQRLEPPPSIARSAPVQSEAAVDSSKAPSAPLPMRHSRAPKKLVRTEERQVAAPNQQTAAEPSHYVPAAVPKDLQRWIQPAPSNGTPAPERPWEEIFESLRQSSRPPQAQRIHQQGTSQGAEEATPRPAGNPPEPIAVSTVRHAIRPRAGSETKCFWERMFLNQPDLRMFK